jgi:hypothetical protein
MAKLILPAEKSYKKVFTINSCKQGGLCLKCRQLINFGQIIVSNGRKNTKYYHESCARQWIIIP